MSTAVMDYAVIDRSRVAAGSACVVTVVHRTPMCTCRWTGRRRCALFLARHDAWMHAADTGCQPSVPP